MQPVVKWMSVGRGSTVMGVDKKATAFLESFGSQEVQVVSIFGNARQGKSFLMNELSGEPGTFPVSSKSDPCTVGIELSTKATTPRELSALRGGGEEEPRRRGFFGSLFGPPVGREEGEEAALVGSDESAVVFADAEGQGDQRTSYDAKLVTPTLLAASVVLFNTKEAPLKDRILQQLGVLVRAAEGVRRETSGFFGHLVVVFRDWTFQDSDSEKVRRQLFDDERGDGSEERNAIRRSLRAAFASIDVALLPPPVENLRSLAASSSDKKTALSLDFRAAVDALRRSVCAKLSSSDDKKKVSGARLAKLTQLYVKTLNAKDVIVPDSAYAEIVKAELRADAEAVEAAARTALFADDSSKDLEQLVLPAAARGSVVVEAVLAPALRGVVQGAESEFAKRALSRGDDVSANPARDVASTLASKLAALERQALELRVRRCLSVAQDRLNEKAANAVTRVLDGAQAERRLKAAADAELEKLDDDHDVSLATVETALRAEAANLRAELQALAKERADEENDALKKLRTSLFTHEFRSSNKRQRKQAHLVSSIDLAALDDAVSRATHRAKETIDAARERRRRSLERQQEEALAQSRLQTLKDEQAKLEEDQRAMRLESEREARRLQDLKTERAELDKKLKEDAAAAASSSSKRKASTRTTSKKKPKISKEDALKEARAAMAQRAQNIIKDHHSGAREGSTPF